MKIKLIFLIVLIKINAVDSKMFRKFTNITVTSSKTDVVEIKKVEFKLSSFNASATIKKPLKIICVKIHIYFNNFILKFINY